MIYASSIARRCLLQVVRKPFIASSDMNRVYPTFAPIWKSHGHHLCTDNGAPRGDNERNLFALKQSWTDQLARAKIPEADSSVNLIVAHAFGKKKVNEVDMNVEPDKTTLNEIEDMLSKRLKGIPVQYIKGEMDFLDMTLEMKEPVFIPRPKTENLAEFIVQQWSLSRDQSARFLEIGCGTGALSLYILRNYPKVRCTAMDISVSACELTTRNATRHELQDRIHVIQGDICEVKTIAELSRDGSYDMIVSNPPYLTEEEMKPTKNTVNYEDQDARYGGTDGLYFVTKILMEVHKLLKNRQSCVWLEVGIGHPEKVQKLVESRPECMLSYSETREDFAGVSRFCKLQLKN